MGIDGRTWKFSLGIGTITHTEGDYIIIIPQTASKKCISFIITRTLVRTEVKKFRTFRQQVTWLGRFKSGKPTGR